MLANLPLLKIIASTGFALTLAAAPLTADAVARQAEEERLLAAARNSSESYLRIETSQPGLPEEERLIFRGFFITESGFAVVPLQALDSGTFQAAYESNDKPIAIAGVVAAHPAAGFAVVRTDQRPSSFLTLSPTKTGVGDLVSIYRAEQNGGALAAPVLSIRKSPISRSYHYIEVLSIGANLGEFGGLHVPAGSPVFDDAGHVTGCLYAPAVSTGQRFLLALPASTLAPLIPKDAATAAIVPLPLPPLLQPADPLATDPAYLAGRHAQASGEAVKAERLLRKALARHPESAVAWQRLGYVLREWSKDEEAMEAFVKAAKFGNNLSPFLLDQADQLSLKGRVGEAVTLLEEACKAAPFDYDLHRAYAIALRSQKDEKGAEKHLRIALEIAPEALSCWTLLSKCLAAQGKWDEEKVASNKTYELDSLYRPR